MLNPTEYYLPDIELFNEKRNSFLVWVPDKKYIVLGASNKSEDALILENVINDKISVLKRPSGGQTVMLTPDNLIISAVFFELEKIQPKEIFNIINNIIISSIELAGIKNSTLNGISDIEISGKKILGSSIYRNKDAILYHAVLNLGEPAITFERYLKHPTKEPEYRKGRKHSDFVTSLKDNGYINSYQFLVDILNEQLNEFFDKLIAKDQ